MTLEFLITSMIVILLPGTGVIYTLAIGLGRGFKQSTIAAFGCTLGILPHILASVVGLAAILHTSAVAFQLIKYLGVLYLLYMAWTIFKDKSMMQVAEEGIPTPALKIITSGMLINILNPKLSLFFLAFLPQFIPAETVNPTSLMIALALVFMLLTLITFIAYGACAALARDFIINRPKVMNWIRYSFAGAFGLLGVKLALSDR